MLLSFILLETLLLTRHSSTAFLGDELASALRNVGARVRKSTFGKAAKSSQNVNARESLLDVNEGYATSRFTTPNASPNRPHAPNSSPIGSRNPSPIRAPLFRSAADTLHAVYSSSAPNISHSLSSSRVAKRARAAEDDDDVMPHHHSFIPRSTFSSPNFDYNDHMDLCDEEEDADMESPTLPRINASRQIRPLKRNMSNHSGQKNPWNTNFMMELTGSKLSPKKTSPVDISTFANLPPD